MKCRFRKKKQEGEEGGKRVIFLRRGVIAAALTVLAVAGIFCAVLFPASTAVSSTARQLPIYSVETTGKRCAISFDAAWGNAKVR